MQAGGHLGHPWGVHLCFCLHRCSDAGAGPELGTAAATPPLQVGAAAWRLLRQRAQAHGMISWPLRRTAPKGDRQFYRAVLYMIDCATLLRRTAYKQKNEQISAVLLHFIWLSIKRCALCL